MLDHIPPGILLFNLYYFGMSKIAALSISLHSFLDNDLNRFTIVVLISLPYSIAYLNPGLHDDVLCDLFLISKLFVIPLYYSPVSTTVLS